MKRFFAFLFTLCMLMALSGCIEQTDPYSITLAAADDNYVETTAETLPMEIVFDRLTVYEGDDYNIIIRGINPDSPEGYVLSMDISNNTEAKETTKTVYTYETDEDGNKQIVGEEQVTTYEGTTYLFVIDTVVVNGKEIEVSFSASLTSDDRTFDQIVLDKETFAELGAITEIQMFISVYEGDTEENLSSRFTPVIYPYGDLSN